MAANSPQDYQTEALGVYPIVPYAVNQDFQPDADGILTLRLFNPAKANTLNAEMTRQLRMAFDAARQNDNIKAVVLRGMEGRKGIDPTKKNGEASNTFGAGMDLEEVQKILERYPSDEQKLDRIAAVKEYCGQFAELFNTIALFEKPIVGITCGPAVGMGATLLVLCDRIFSTSNATISYPEKQRGRTGANQLEPTISGPYVLNSGSGSDGIDANVAIDHLISGKPFTVELLRKVSEDDDLADLEGQLNKALQGHIAGTAPIEKQPPHVAKIRGGGKKGGHNRHIEIPEQEANFGDKMIALAALHRIGINKPVIDLSTQWLAEQICDIGTEGLKNMLPKKQSPAENDPGNRVMKLTEIVVSPANLPDPPGT